MEATPRPAEVPQQAAILEHLDEYVNLDLVFTDQHGKKRALRDLLIPNRPLILAPVYFECPRLCNLTQDGLVKLLNGLDLKLGQDYKVVSLSFDEEEGPEVAQKKADRYYELLTEPELGKNGGWEFLVGKQAAIQELMTQIGFSFAKNQGEFIHAAILVLLTPDGKISRYIYGIDYPPKDLRFALVEAARGKIGSTLDKVFLFCFRYDHLQGKYTLAIWNIIRAICLGLLVVLVTFLLRLRFREKEQQALGL